MLKRFTFIVSSARVTLVFVVVLVCAGCAKSERASDANASSLPPVVATVNEREIPTKLYQMFLRNGREELGLNEATEEGRRKLALLREGIVSDLIDRALIADEAARRGLSLAPEHLKEAEASAVRQLGGEKKFDEYLASHALTREEYREVYVHPLYAERLRAVLSESLRVPDEEVRAFYEAHWSEPEFQRPERVRAAHILIDARPKLIEEELRAERGLAGDALARAVRAEMERRRARAEDVRRRASAGADFATLAREASDDTGTRADGGDLGIFTRNSHSRAFDEAAFALKPGTISRVVETEYGFHVVKVAEREAARTLTLEEAAPQIRRRLLARSEAAMLRDWLKDARRRARIRINEPFRTGALRDEFPTS